MLLRINIISLWVGWIYGDFDILVVLFNSLLVVYLE